MAIDRLGMLQKLLEESPDDAFTRYAVAMEFKKAGREGEALAGYQEVTRRHPDYVPGFQMHGQLLMELDRHEEAEGVLKLGLEAANRGGINKAIGEIEELLEEVALVLE